MVYSSLNFFAAIVMKGDELIYERYNSKKGIDSYLPLLGMSMSKNAAGAAVGALLYDGRLKSLDDKADYQPSIYQANGRPVFAFQGHGGQFLVLNGRKGMALLTLSFNESYAAGNLFKDITKFAEQLD